MFINSDNSILFRHFVNSIESVENLNKNYLELFQKLYTETQKTIIVTLKCGNFMTSKCVRPLVLEITVFFIKLKKYIFKKPN